MTSIIRKTVVLGVILAAICSAQEKELADGWRVLRNWKDPNDLKIYKLIADDTRMWKIDWAEDSLPGKNEGWIDLEKSRTRAHKLANPYEPSLPIWLERELELGGTSPWILEIENRRIIDAAWLDGTRLTDISDVHKEVHTEHTRAIAKADPYKIRWPRDYYRGISVRRDREISKLKQDRPALFVLQPGGRRLLLQAWEIDLYSSLLGKVELRRPTLEDIIVPYAHTKSDGAIDVNNHIGVLQRVPGNYTIIAEIEVQDFIGKILRTESRTLKLNGDAQREFLFPQKSDDEYKAIITFRIGEASLPPVWLYFQPRLKETATRIRFSLEGGDWQVKHVKSPDPLKLPLGEKGWRPTWVPGQQRRAYEHYVDRHKVKQYVVRKRFQLPNKVRGEKIVLKVDEIQITGEFFLNGKRLGRLNFNDIPAELDITDALNYNGENEIIVAIGLPEIAAKHMGLKKAFDTFIGASRRRMHNIGHLVIEARKKVAIERVTVRTSVTDKRITTLPVVRNDSAQPVTATLESSVLFKGDEVLKLPRLEVTIPPGEMKQMTAKADWSESKLWSPWSPTLYGLKSTLTVDGKVVDSTLDRFGFREWGIDGDQYTLNGRPFHAMGHEYSSDKPTDLYSLIDFYVEVGHILEARRRGLTHLRRYREDAMSLNLMDEAGMTAACFTGPWDNGRGNVGRSPETTELYRKEAEAWMTPRLNHASLHSYYFSNEAYLSNLRTDDLRDTFIPIVDRIQELDPTRIVTVGHGDDLDGHLDVFDHHYGSTWWIGQLDKQVPGDVHNRACNLDRIDGGKRYVHADKPFHNSEYDWLRRWRMAEFYHDAHKFSPYREPGYRPFRIHDLIIAARKREQSIANYRRSRTAGHDAFSPFMLTNRNFAPIVGRFFNENTRFWADKPIVRELDIYNDSGKDETVTLELLLAGSSLWKKSVDVKHGNVALLKAEIPPLGNGSPTETTATLVTTVDGREVCRRVQHWTIVPRSWLGDLSKVRVAVFDPDKKTQGLVEAIGVTPTYLSQASEIDPANFDLVVVAEDVDNRVFATNPEALKGFAQAGGTALILRQKSPGDWLPIALQADTAVSGFEALLYVRHDPLFNGMLPEDFYDWGNSMLVYGMAYQPAQDGTVRTLIGKEPQSAMLIDAIMGDGRVLISSLELTPKKAVEEPAAAKLLANIARVAAAKSTPKRVKTLVYSGEPGARTELLQNEMKLKANFVTEFPDSLEPYGVVVLTDMKGKTGALPNGDVLKHFVQNGGQLVVQQATPELLGLLKKQLGLNATLKQRKGVRSFIVKQDPILDGVSDGHLAWFGNIGHLPFVGDKHSEHAVLNAEIAVDGGKVLTWPKVLVRKDVGKGQILFDQTRWAEVSNKTGSGWGSNSQKIARRLQIALLTNLGSEFEYPGRQKVDLAGLQLEPLDLSKNVNWSRVDEEKGDGKGWIDIGRAYHMGDLPAGRLEIQKVPYQIVDENANGGQSIIALRAGPRFKQLPEETLPISVGNRAVKSIFFLHTTAYANSPKGATVWEYEIRYQGYSKLIEGENKSDFIVTVPVQSQVNVDDWLGLPKTAHAWDNGQKARHLRHNLFMQRWDNPRPDTAVESIVVRSKKKDEIPFVFAITLGLSAENLVPGDVAAMQPFSRTMQKGRTTEQSGKFPSGWSANVWHNTTTGRVFMKDGAIALQNLKGRPSLQFYTSDKNLPVKAGETYRISFSYRTDPGTESIFSYRTPKSMKIRSDVPANSSVSLSDTGGQWKTMTFEAVIESGKGGLSLNLQNRASGEDHTLYVRDIWVTRLGSGK